MTSELRAERATNQERESKPEPAQRLPENPPQDRQSRTEGQAARTYLLSGSAPMSSANKYLVSSNECSIMMCNKASSQLLRQQALAWTQRYLTVYIMGQ